MGTDRIASFYASLQGNRTMNAQTYLTINANIESIQSRMANLAASFASVSPRTAADEAFIDLLAGQAAALQQAAQALKTIVYVPPPADPEVPAE